MSEEEEEELAVPSSTLAAVVGCSAVLMVGASVALMSYSLISTQKLGRMKHLLVYFMAIGLTGILQVPSAFPSLSSPIVPARPPPWRPFTKPTS